MPFEKTPAIQVLTFIRAILAVAVVAPLAEIAASNLVLPNGTCFVVRQ
jgi:hypothetical protein